MFVPIENLQRIASSIMEVLKHERYSSLEKTLWTIPIPSSAEVHRGQCPLFHVSNMVREITLGKSLFYPSSDSCENAIIRV